MRPGPDLANDTVVNDTELVVLVDGHGRAVGTADKALVHGPNTPLHLAFSAYLFDGAGRLLLTQRAQGKRTFPGVWTNTVCGHPLPGEPLADAVRRRALRELGLSAERLRLVLPRFSYRAEMDGVVEHELCPVYAGWLARGAGVAAAAEEVADIEWVEWAAFTQEVQAGSRAVSPWCRDQVAQLVALGADPLRWPAADEALLPPAAQLR